MTPAEELQERIRDFADYRRSTRAATRLFRLSTESLIGVCGASVGGVAFGVGLGLLKVITVGYAAALTSPFFLLVCMSLPMAAYRFITRRADQLSSAPALQALDDEERRASDQADVPKEYLDGLYRLRSAILTRELAPQSPDTHEASADRVRTTESSA